MNNYRKEYMEFITTDRYISRKEMNSFLCAFKKDLDIIKKNDRSLYETLSSLEKIVDNHNTEFLNRKLIEEKEYFDTMFKGIDDSIFLDMEQRKAILVEEDYSMIIAGAGSGKTTTMAAKVKYLVEKKGIDPKDIMLISYTNKAIDELKERINGKFKLPVDIATFHKFGVDILKKTNSAPFKILTNNYSIVSDYFEKELAKDNEKLKDFLYFFLYFFDIPTGALKFKSLEEYHKFKKRNDYITLKSRLTDYNENIIADRKTSKYTIRGEFLRSSEEVMIANYLFMNNIEYDYEKPYPFLTTSSYLPDFTIYANEKVYYLEHYGVDENKRNFYFDNKKTLAYIKGIDSKAALHNKFNTELICTYSRYEDGRNLINHLEEELLKRNIILTKKSDEEIFSMLSDTTKDTYYTRFIMFCMDFIKNFKNRGYGYSNFDKLALSVTDERTLMFLDFIKGVYKYYQRELKINSYIDFEDMINDSYMALKSVAKEELNLNYKYIIIDEYQDISLQRFNLTKEISRISDAKVIAVGDDWQAIFAFAGSDITLFTMFKELMGYGEELQITTTYRNSQELIDIAGQFVMKNSTQIKKRLKSNKHLLLPVSIVTYDDYTDKFNNRLKTVDSILGELVKKYGEEQKILVIGRYNFDKYHLIKSDYFYEYSEDKIRSVNFPNLDITYLTAHSSKGLGYDNVIIINGSEGVYGFPSQMKDDPILKLISIKDESFSFAEERRLFYVALTRSKNKVYIVTPEHNQSAFVKELKSYPHVEYVKNKSSKLELNMECPKCKMPLIKRHSEYFGINNVYECSNEKELCDFKTNNLKFRKNIVRCPKCEGHLIVKHSVKNNDYFMACSNYENGCNFTHNINF